MFQTSYPTLGTSRQRRQCNQNSRTIRTWSRRALLPMMGAILVLLSGCRKIQVVTYHNDNLRMGWNQFERHLNYGNVNPHALTALSVTLDDEVDTQPLIVPDIRITAGSHQGKHDVVYVATEGNTIYAIDANSGQILLQPNFGAPVPMLNNPAVPAYPCGNNGPNIGIDGTPVIDSTSNTMYVIIYTFEQNTPTYRIHALDLGNLTDRVPPQGINSSNTSHTLVGGGQFSFDPAWQRQRPGMLLSNGVVYAGFGSFCDWGGQRFQQGPASRGWVLGWQAGSLKPLQTNHMNNTITSAPCNEFLASVWMSGYGLAGDLPGNIYFVSGNSDCAGTTYDGFNNIAESVVRLNPDLSMTPPNPPTPNPSLFTPSNVASLDQGDTDLGSGGVTLLPGQPSNPGNLAIAAGKDGRMFLLNRDNLGGFTSNNAGQLDVGQIGACWCGQTYFNDGTPHIVSSGGNQVMEWDLQLPQLKLVSQGASVQLPSGGDSGFFTSVSSWGKSDAIIWAVSHPDSARTVWLYAFRATPAGAHLAQPLFSAAAGTWPYGGNANIVPTVANGKIYVASYQQLMIFGHHGHKGKKVEELHLVAPERMRIALREGRHEIYGTIREAKESHLTVRTRDGKQVEVDASAAVQSGRSIPLVAEHNVEVVGTYDANGTLHAESIQRAKSSSSWPSDR